LPYFHIMEQVRSICSYGDGVWRAKGRQAPRRMGARLEFYAVASWSMFLIRPARNYRSIVDTFAVLNFLPVLPVARTLTPPPQVPCC
jgi:hypothetical protein